MADDKPVAPGASDETLKAVLAQVAELSKAVSELPDKAFKASDAAITKRWAEFEKRLPQTTNPAEPKPAAETLSKEAEKIKVLEEQLSQRDKREKIMERKTLRLAIAGEAQKQGAIDPELVSKMIEENVRLSETGEYEVLGADGSVKVVDGQRQNLAGAVKEFLGVKKYLVAASNRGGSGASGNDDSGGGGGTPKETVASVEAQILALRNSDPLDGNVDRKAVQMAALARRLAAMKAKKE